MDFVIENSVLKKYEGAGDVVVIVCKMVSVLRYFPRFAKGF